MLIIGIAGGTGCGKTTVIKQIMNEFLEDEVGVISQDSYYKNNSNMSFKKATELKRLLLYILSAL